VAYAHQEAETTLHLMKHCSFTQQVWLHVTLSLNLNSSWRGATLQACFLDWSNSCTSFPHFPAIFCWNIWLERNRVLFDSGRPSTNLISQRILGSIDIPRARNYPARLSRLPPVLDGGTIVGWFDGAA
jgi:hypothetical protein